MPQLVNTSSAWWSWSWWCSWWQLHSWCSWWSWWQHSRSSFTCFNKSLWRVVLLKALVIACLVSWSQGVVIIFTWSLYFLIILMHSSNWKSLISWVLLKIINEAYSIWLLKNSPKFLVYKRHFLASITVI